MKSRKAIAILLPLLIIFAGFAYPVISKVFDSTRLQETNFELSILEFKGENLNTNLNPAKAFFKYKDKLIELKIMNEDLSTRIVVMLPMFPEDVSSHFLDGKLLISGGDIEASSPQEFPILLVRQPKANTRLEKFNKIISQSKQIQESALSKEMGILITNLQKKFQKKPDFKTYTHNTGNKFDNLSNELDELNIAFDSTLEELETIDKELDEVLS